MAQVGQPAGAARGQEFALGLRDTLPLMFGSIAFGVIFGTLAIGAGLSPWATMAMSLFVFSGSAQFIAILLLGTGSGLWVIWFATLVLNLRHLLYAATLVDHVRHLRQGWRFPLAAFLTDEAVAGPGLGEVLVQDLLGALVGERDEIGRPLQRDLEMLDLAEIALEAAAGAARGLDHDVDSGGIQHVLWS